MQRPIPVVIKQTMEKELGSEKLFVVTWDFLALSRFGKNQSHVSLGRLINGTFYNEFDYKSRYLRC